MQLPQPLPPLQPLPRFQSSVKGRLAAAGLCTSLTWVCPAGSVCWVTAPPDPFQGPCRAHSRSARLSAYKAVYLLSSKKKKMKRKSATFNSVFHTVSLSAPCVLGIPTCPGIFEERGMLWGTGEDRCSL